MSFIKNICPISLSFAQGCDKRENLGQDANPFWLVMRLDIGDIGTMNYFLKVMVILWGAGMWGEQQEGSNNPKHSRNAFPKKNPLLKHGSRVGHSCVGSNGFHWTACL